MRSHSRIQPILDLIKDIWIDNPDLRLMQLLDNANMDFYTEDVNDVVYKLCFHYSFPFRHYAMWGVVRGKTTTYKRLTDLSSTHLRNIINNVKPIKYIKDTIIEILEERGEFEDDEVPKDRIPKKETVVEFTTNWVEELNKNLFPMKDFINKEKAKKYK